MTGTAGASNPQVKTQIGASTRVAKPAREHSQGGDTGSNPVGTTRKPQVRTSLRQKRALPDAHPARSELADRGVHLFVARDIGQVRDILRPEAEDWSFRTVEESVRAASSDLA
jgi:hypothetical protein